jgi:hypothetical protein
LAVSPAELASQPDQPEAIADAPRRGRHLAAAPEIDPEARGRAYDAARDAADDSGYWRDVPRFHRMWADHVERWPPHPTDRSFTHELAIDKAISQIRLNEPNVTAEMTKVSRDDAWLEGLDHRLKGDARLTDKITRQLRAEPDQTTSEVVGRIPDAIRYTFCAVPDSYTGAFYDIKARLEAAGYEMYQCKNSWSNAEYKGINTRWATPDGQRFEVQFHTPESFYAKQHITHESYERLRDPRTDNAEREELERFQRDVCSRLRAPAGVSGILDFKKEGY